MGKYASYVLSACLFWLLPFAAAFPYPLDGYEETGIPRLQAQKLIQEGKLAGVRRPPGELLPLEQVDLRLLDYPDLDLPAANPDQGALVQTLLGKDADHYGFAALDFSDPEAPVYFEWRGDAPQHPGSVGKVLVALAFFQALADAHPDDIEARKRILHDTVVTADDLIGNDTHGVAFWDAASAEFSRRSLQVGDRANLWTYLDWMLSVSSNASAAMIQEQVLLLRRFGAEYPVSDKQVASYIRDTPKRKLSKALAAAMVEPVKRNALDPGALHQGDIFSRIGKQRIPGTRSHVTARGLAEFMLRMEQGRLVDPWSSREIKRLLYLTEYRMRYASAQVLNPAAVYFKSGSLYSCRPPRGDCGPHRGTRYNYMSSMALIEYPSVSRRLRYIAVVLSNVVGKDSARDHRDLARAIQAMITVYHPIEDGPRDTATTDTATAEEGAGLIGYQSVEQEQRLTAEIQEALDDLGYDVGDIDGTLNWKTRVAIQAFLRKHELGLAVEPTPGLLEAIDKAAVESGARRPAPAIVDAGKAGPRVRSSPVADRRDSLLRIRGYRPRRVNRGVGCRCRSQQVFQRLSQLIDRLWCVDIHDLIDDPAIGLAVAHDALNLIAQTTQRAVPGSAVLVKGGLRILRAAGAQHFDIGTPVITGTADLGLVLLQVAGRPGDRGGDQTLALLLIQSCVGHTVSGVHQKRQILPDHRNPLAVVGEIETLDVQVLGETQGNAPDDVCQCGASVFQTRRPTVLAPAAADTHVHGVDGLAWVAGPTVITLSSADTGQVSPFRD